ncbi:hypothetical protein, partial [Vreelandella songnenensis]|uniref:hypothetical protein n=1 Tax=Vreelandella songnenensis TaxID=1176243 RepID=UPI001ABF9197
MASSHHYCWVANIKLTSVTNDNGEATFQYDHAQRHTLTANGAPQQSQFGDLPALNWHTYGSGHL